MGVVRGDMYIYACVSVYLPVYDIVLGGETIRLRFTIRVIVFLLLLNSLKLR